ncbi:MAG TPA: hypothetical protein VHT27_07230 [Solirubrobacteraceae bacterium]|nr:hypothetical protein [Solirubrobacteraceae bacterium]
MSTAAPPGPGSAPLAHPPVAAPDGDACPLCGAPLAPTQEWCLHCGAAARTRLAAAPNWRAPIVAGALLLALLLAVLAAALVKLAGDSGPAPAPLTHTITTAAAPAAATTVPATTLPATTAPAAKVPARTAPATVNTTGATSTPGGTAAPGTTTARTSTPTTSTPSKIVPPVVTPPGFGSLRK